MNPERHRGLPHGGRAIPERRARADIDGLALPGRFRDEIRRRHGAVEPAASWTG